MDLLAASLINVLLACSVSSGGWPCLGRFAVVSYPYFQFLHSFIRDLFVVFLGLHDGNKPLWASQNCCIFTEIKLHTGGKCLLICLLKMLKNHHLPSAAQLCATLCWSSSRA